MAKKSEETIMDAEFEEIEAGGNKALATVTQTEMLTKIKSSRMFPRHLGAVRTKIFKIVQLDKDTAASMLYSLPKGGKIIEGPSIRFAESLAQCWGNCRVSSRVLRINREEKFVEAVGYFHDLESNVEFEDTVTRPIVDKEGRLYRNDMIVTTCNAARSIAKRNAILAGVPRPVYWPAYEDAKRVAKGQVKGLVKTRQDMIAAFGKIGVTPDLLFKQIGVSSEQEISLDHVATLRGMYSTISSEEATREEVFASLEESEDAKKPKTKSAKKLDDIGEKPEREPLPDSSLKAQEAGKKAYYAGKPLSSCPAKYTDLDANAWEEGWGIAQEEDGRPSEVGEM